jgi:glycerol-3-phosphate dehydrogenase (NAD(P)+)
MARIGIVGGGAFGTAMACVLRRSGHAITLWAREPEVVAAVNRDSRNPQFLDGVDLPPGIAATADMGAAVHGAELVLLAPPAQHMRAVAVSLKSHLQENIAVVSCSKGIERETLALMPELLREVLPSSPAAVLSGPSFARELAAGLPCGVALACADPAAAVRLARTLAAPGFCVHPTGDVVGVALGGVMKNVIAIAAGMAAGRKLGENARATLVTLGLEETMSLGVAKGARPGTFFGLAGVGDMMLTANSMTSRNTSLGYAMGEGWPMPEKPPLCEGFFSTPAVAALARRLDVKMPIPFALERVLAGGEPVDAAIAGVLRSLPPSVQPLSSH